MCIHEKYFDLNLRLILYIFDISASESSHFAINLKNNAKKAGMKPARYFSDLSWAMFRKKWEVEKEHVLRADVSLLV